MGQNLTHRINRAIVESLQITADRVHDGLAMGVIPEWDSIAHVNLIAALETKLNVRIPVDRIADLVSYQAILDYFTQQTAEATI